LCILNFIFLMEHGKTVLNCIVADVP
jgi:hypothetical protein